MARMSVCGARPRLRRARPPPYPGELGKRVYENVSKLAWQRWLKHQTMLINEYRLTPIEPKARKFLEDEMQKFFFGEGSEAPPDFKPKRVANDPYAAPLAALTPSGRAAAVRDQAEPGRSRYRSGVSAARDS